MDGQADNKVVLRNKVFRFCEVGMRALTLKLVKLICKKNRKKESDVQSALGAGVIDGRNPLILRGNLSPAVERIQAGMMMIMIKRLD